MWDELPNTVTCSVSGFIKDGITLADRAWTCSACGAAHNRDHNATINIHPILTHAIPPATAVKAHCTRQHGWKPCLTIHRVVTNWSHAGLQAPSFRWGIVDEGICSLKADAEKRGICYNKVIESVRTLSEHKITGSFAPKNQ